MAQSMDGLHISPFQQGVSLEHGILTLDARSSAHLNFLSSPRDAWNEGRVWGRQIFASDDTCRAGQVRFPNAPWFPGAWFRPVTFGNLTLELIPTGLYPGSSLLRVEKRGETLLYTSSLVPPTGTHMRKWGLKDPETLLLRCVQPPSIGGDGAGEKRRTYDAVLDYAQKIIRVKETLVLVLDPFWDAPVVAAALWEHRIPFVLEGILYTLWDKLRGGMALGGVPPWLQALGQVPPAEGPHIVLWPNVRSWKGRFRHLAPCVWASLLPPGETMQGFEREGVTFSEVFPISHTPDGGDLVAFVRSIQPKRCRLFGPAAQETASWLMSSGLPAELFESPLQETLF